MKHLAVCAGACFVLLTAGQAWGQDRGDTVTTRGTERLGTAIMSASVTLHGGGAFGKVHDFVITEDGCIDYVVILEGANYIFVPWNAIVYTPAQRTIVINVQRERLRDVTFTRDRWPTFDATFRTRVRTVFGDARDVRRPGDRDTGGATDPNRKSPDRRDPTDPGRTDPPRRTDPPKKADPPKKG